MPPPMETTSSKIGVSSLHQTPFLSYTLPMGTANAVPADRAKLAVGTHRHARFRRSPYLDERPGSSYSDDHTLPFPARTYCFALSTCVPCAKEFKQLSEALAGCSAAMSSSTARRTQCTETTHQSSMRHAHYACACTAGHARVARPIQYPTRTLMCAREGPRYHAAPN